MSTKDRSDGISAKSGSTECSKIEALLLFFKVRTI